jgi:hypothetical protein
VTSREAVRPASPASSAGTAAPSNARILRTKIDFAIPALWSATARLWASPDLHQRYVDYLQTMHQMLRATVPLMSAAIEQCRRRAGDPVADGVLAYLAGHIREEEGHDDWLRQDLDLICADGAELLAAMPSAAVAAAVGSQYYWLAHHHPVCLLGHIAVLEGYPASPGLAERLARLSGHPREAFRTIHAHAGLDRRHRDELFAALDALPLGPEHHGMLGVSALHTIGSTAAVFEDLARRRSGPHRLRAEQDR